MYGMDLLYKHTKYGGGRESCGSCIRKCLIFFLCFFVTLSNYEKIVIMETLLSSVIMAPLRRGRFLVVHLYSCVACRM